MPHIRYIDGLRALSVMAVVLYHLNGKWLPGGFVGVDVFFVISGFVVTASLTDHGGERLPAYLSGFYARRLARLMPALVAMLLATTLAHVLLVPSAWFNRAAEEIGQAAFLGISNWVLDRHTVNYFEPRAELNPFTHTWSLGVEEQFYLIAPLLIFWALAAGVARPGRRHALLAIAALALLSLTACLAVGVLHGPRQVFYLLPFRFWELAAGVLLRMRLDRARALAARIGIDDSRSAWLGLGAIGLALAAPASAAYPYLRALLAVVGTLLLLCGDANQPRDALRRGLGRAAPVWLGQRSYALYLWHWPVFVMARWTTGLTVWPQNLLAVGLSIALAALSFRWIEQPVRRSAALQARAPSQRIAILVALVAASWWLAGWLHAHQRQLSIGLPARHAGDWYDDTKAVASARRSERRCEPILTRTDVGQVAGAGRIFDPGACGHPALPRLVVAGDSHTMSLLPMMEQLAAEEGRRVEVYSAPGCGVVSLVGAADERPGGDCHRFAQAVAEHLLRSARPGDIVFLPSLRLPRLVHLGGLRRADVDPAAGPLALTESERAGVGRATVDAQAWLDSLTRRGMRVVIEAPQPIFRIHPFACVDPWTRPNPECAPGWVESREQLERFRAPMMAALAALAARDPLVSLWDPLPLLCDDQHCAALREGRPLFFDGDHLSPYGNLVLLPPFRQWLSRMGPTPEAPTR